MKFNFYKIKNLEFLRNSSLGILDFTFFSLGILEFLVKFNFYKIKNLEFLRNSSLGILVWEILFSGFNLLFL